MASLNKVFLIGNLTKPPELRYTPSGTAVADLRLAVNRNYTTQGGEKREETCFLTVVVWGKQAESCGEYLDKGSPILVEGRLQRAVELEAVTRDRERLARRIHDSVLQVLALVHRREAELQTKIAQQDQRYSVRERQISALTSERDTLIRRLEELERALGRTPSTPRR